MDEEMIFLLQQLEEAFKDMTGCSLRESNRAAEYIRRNRKIEDSHPVSARALRDYWPSGKKSKTSNGRPVVSSIPLHTTLNPIAECAGYKSWEAFKSITLRKVITKDTYFDPKDFNVEKMTKDDPPIIIGWYPHYFIRLQYLGNYKFEILSFSHNLRRNYKDKKELEIYGFEVRYAYEVADVVGIRPPKDEINTDKEKENEYVSGCPFHPELRLLTEPKNHKYPEEEDVSAFIVRSY